LEFVFDEYNMRALEPYTRFQKIKKIVFEDEVDGDESIRWDCIWLAGETYEDNVDDDFKEKIADFMVNVMFADSNAIVRHEAAFQIGLHNMRQKIPHLLSVIKTDGDLVKHEAIEAIGLLRERGEFAMAVLQDATKDKSPVVSDTAKFVLKRLERLKDKGEYKGEAIL
jgi:HEAT repeat protein